MIVRFDKYKFCMKIALPNIISAPKHQEDTKIPPAAGSCNNDSEKSNLHFAKSRFQGRHDGGLDQAVHTSIKLHVRELKLLYLKFFQITINSTNQHHH